MTTTTTTPQAPSAPAGQANGQGQTPSQPSGQAESDNVKRLQQVYDRQLHSMRQREQELLSRLEQLETRDLDEEGQTQYRLQQLQRELQRRDQMAQEAQAELQKVRLLSKISAQTGITVDALEAAQNPDEAWEIGLSYLKKQTETTKTQVEKAERERERQEENQVDIGGGTTFSNLREWEEAYGNARKRKDSRLMVDLLSKREGLTNA